MLAACVASRPAFGQRESDDRVQLALGVGVIASPRPHVGADSEIFPIPLLGIRYKSFFFEGVRAGFRFSPAERFELATFLGARFDGLDPDDSVALEGMNEASTSADFGVEAKGIWRHAEVGLTALTDVLGESGGQEVELEVSFPFRPASWRLAASVSANYQSGALVDHYYGVDRDEIRPGRPAYRAGDTVNLGIGFRGARRWSNGWMLLMSVDWERLGDAITDSPIVEDDETVGGFVGLTFTF